MTGATGNVVAAYHYDGYGNVTVPGSNPAGRLVFQGQWLDANAGLHYMDSETTTRQRAASPSVTPSCPQWA